MSTKELQRKLKELGKYSKRSRSELTKRYDREVQSEEPERGPEEKSSSSMQPPKSHASENPMMVMVDEATGNKYMKVVDHKGLEGEGDNSWLVKDMHQDQCASALASKVCPKKCFFNFVIFLIL